MIRPLLQLTLILCTLGTPYGARVFGTSQRSIKIEDKPQRSRLASLFYAKVKLPIKDSASIKRIIYGNRIYGYFATNDFHIFKNDIALNLVPPGYRYKIEFFVERSKGSKKPTYIGAKKFKSPAPDIYLDPDQKNVTGQFSSNYFMVTGALPRGLYWDPAFKSIDTKAFGDSRYRFTFVAILNRIGETVWLHVPIDDNEIFHTYIQSKPIKKGIFGLVMGKKAGLFQIVRFDGQMIRHLRTRDVAKPFTMHHDFLYSRQNGLLAVSSRAAKARNAKIRQLGQTFLADTIIKVDLGQEKSHKMFDFLSSFNPSQNEFWTGDDLGDHKFVLWNMPKVDFDFLHINSLQEVTDGYVVGIRNLNKIVMLDRPLAKIKWTLGTDSADTFTIKGIKDQFHHMHTPRMNSRGNIVLFDNGFIEQSSRIVEYQLDHKTKTAKVVWQFNPEPKLYSRDRGSIAILDNGNIVAYFVNPNEGKDLSSPTAPRDIMIEIDYKTGNEKARMVRHFQVQSPGYRATPIDEIGRETFVGRSLD